MLDKKYNHVEVEKNKYDYWLKKGYFKSGNTDKKPFTIVIPPPNVTGKLHLGHALDTSIQDIIIRYKRMQGYDALWLPGMDHAGIATQAKVDKRLRDMGINPRGMEREKWLEHAWSWKDEYASNIHEQWKKLGLSLDYDKERFTLDEGLNNAVNRVFVDLYNKGLIYRGERIINWDPLATTALSNEEVIYRETKAYLYYLKYQIEDSDDFIVVATTRPETLFGDTAVAVNPTDDRYKGIIGKNVVLPILNKKIPVIGDDYADPTFGTGAVKITPAHDPNDFEVGNRHNLERINVINSNGTMNENAFIYNGLDRFEARKKIVDDLKTTGLLIKVEEIIHNVGYSERTDVIVEPYLSNQWFVKMAPLAQNVLKMQQDKDKKINFVPKRFEKIMNHWMTITYDWCISRQLWWGHRIPAWYRNEEVYVGLTPPKGDGWKQDDDVLDTWFSSALWPFSTLGWPNDSSDLKRYYPTDVLVTAYDIIFFWVCRMAFQGFYFLNERPFKECLIHGLIRDKQGRKMSKSLGNGVDPMDLIDKYGADSLRFYLTTNTSFGTDLRYDEEKVAATWNFVNKLWNASRYVLMKSEDISDVNIDNENLNYESKWILSRMNKTIKDITKNMDKYKFNLVGTSLYSFIWDDFCDNYIEFTKSSDDVNTKKVLLKVLNTILKLLHPFMPYVTEEIYTTLNNTSIMISDYPIYNKSEVFNNEEKVIDDLIKDITNIRNIKITNSITKDSKIIMKALPNIEHIYKSILKITDDNIVLDEPNMKKYNYHSENIDITYYEDAKCIDINKITDDINKLKISIEKREKLLSNESYVNKAPKSVVDLDKIKLSEEKTKLSELEELVKNV